MPSPTANQVTFPHLWDREFATIAIHYKSGKRYLVDTTVGDARKRATAAINRKSALWIKVTVPNADCSKARVAIWDRIGKWTVTITSLPKTKDQ